MKSPQESKLALLQNPSGDQQGEAFAAQYQKWYAKLTGIAAGVLGHQEGAEDVVQHAAGVAIAKGHQFESEAGFLAWMVSSVRLCAVNQRRKLCRRRTYSTDSKTFATLESSGSGPEGLPIDPVSGELLADQASFEDQLLNALQELTSEARCCLLLRTVHNLNYSEIAELLQIRPGTAMSHVYRSRQFLPEPFDEQKVEWTILAFLMSMHEDTNPTQDEQFEAYLDGALPSAGREALCNRLRVDADLRTEEKLQDRINQALRKLFPVVDSPTPFLEQPLVTDGRELARKSRQPIRRLLLFGAAAALAGILAAWLSQQDDGPTPFFRPTPLAQVYLDTIRDGFKPYYECSDDQRFAQTFARRQGKPLRLLPLPKGTKMLGLSYPGGLSRDTTAMLCTVRGEPVMVFVDRETADTLHITTSDEEGTKIFRAHRDGLVFYEVSRLDVPCVMQFLALATPASIHQ